MICRPSFLSLKKKKNNFYLFSFKSYLTFGDTRSVMRMRTNKGVLLIVWWVLYSYNAPRSLLAPPLQRWPTLRIRHSRYVSTSGVVTPCTLRHANSACRLSTPRPRRRSSSTDSLVQIDQQHDQAGLIIPPINPTI